MHYLALLEQKMRALDQAAPFKGWLFSVNYSFALTTVISPYERHLPPSTADDIFVEFG
jgi:hypothetical protein